MRRASPANRAVTHVVLIGPFSSSGALFRKWLVAKCKGPWEGEKWEGSDVLPVFSFPPTFEVWVRGIPTTATVTRTSKKAIGLVNKTRTVHVHHDFLYISLSSLHDYDVKMSNFTYYGGRKHAKTKFSFSFWTWIRLLGRFNSMWVPLHLTK